MAPCSDSPGAGPSCCHSSPSSVSRPGISRSSFRGARRPIPLANRVYHSDFETLFSIRTALGYDKGSPLLAALHKELGDQTFLTFLKSFQKSFRWKFGSTRHVVGLLQFIAKKDFTPFFEANFWGTGMPKI